MVSLFHFILQRVCAPVSAAHHDLQHHLALIDERCVERTTRWMWAPLAQKTVDEQRRCVVLLSISLGLMIMSLVCI